MIRTGTSDRSRALAIALALLVLVTLGAFWPVLRNDFVNYDDDRYVTRNRHVQEGLSSQTLLWACTTTYASNWHPLTWISHMTDWEIYGRKPLGHHRTSLLLHIANTLLVFLLLERTTGAVGKSAFAAALFGVHPLHVQSVAWIAERKDVLSTLFWLLGLHAYVAYVRARSAGCYALVIAAFAIGLTAKPMLVTFPATLALLDLWPLRRAGGLRIRDKIPLLALSAASAAVTIVAQRRGEAVATLASFPWTERLANAAVSCAFYLWKTIWPRGLSVFYPRLELAPLAVAGSVLLLGAVSWLAVRERSRSPYLLVGWLWYLITLVPVLGLVQVGAQARADRYTYVPLIGIFWIVAWGLPDLVRSARGKFAATNEQPSWIVAPAAAVVLVLALVCRANVAMWHDSVTLFEHALRIEPRNPLAHNNLGVALTAQGRPEEALVHYEEAVRLRPEDPKAHNNLGTALAAQGRTEEALREYAEAIRLRPEGAEGHSNLASALLTLGRPEEAARHAVEAVRLDPELADARYQLGAVLGRQGKDPEAIEQYEQALRIAPDDAQLHNNLGSALARTGRMNDAVAHFQAALSIRPDYGVAHANLAAALLVLGRVVEAREEIARARQAGVEPPAQLVRDVMSAR